ncbi:MAG: glycosyltransferase family 39 protein, partial [Oceanococcaceae bacterium]
MSFRRGRVLGPMLQWLDQDEAHKTARLFLLAILVLGSGLGLRDPWPPDEPALALMMRAMADGGPWLVPYLGGVPFQEHPPLSVWIGAFVMNATGSLRLGFLLPSVLAAMAVLWLVYDLGRRLWGARAGRLSALVLLAAFQFNLQAHTGQVDMLFTLWVTLALYALMRYLLLQPEPRWLIYGGLAMGLGMLTKGAGYIAALVLLPWLWMRWQSWSDLPPRAGKRVLWLLPLAAAVPVLAWAVPALGLALGSAAELDIAERTQLLLNLLGGADLHLGGASEGLWHMPLQALLLWLPLPLLLPWLAPIWRERLAARDPRTGLLLGYALAVLLLFTVLPGRQGVQLLPALPAVALLTGANLGGTWWRPEVQWVSRFILIGIGLALLILVAQARLQPQEFGLRLPPDTPFGLYWGLGVLGLLALILALAFRFGSRNQALALPVFIGVGWFLFGWGVYPWLNNIRTPELIMQRAEAIMPAQGVPGEIGMLDWRPQFALFSRVPLRPLDNTAPVQSVTRWCAARTAVPRYVLVPDGMWQDLRARLPVPLGAPAVL